VIELENIDVDEKIGWESQIISLEDEINDIFYLSLCINYSIGYENNILDLYINNTNTIHYEHVIKNNSITRNFSNVSGDIIGSYLFMNNTINKVINILIQKYTTLYKGIKIDSKILEADLKEYNLHELQEKCIIKWFKNKARVKEIYRVLEYSDIFQYECLATFLYNLVKTYWDIVEEIKIPELKNIEQVPPQIEIMNSSNYSGLYISDKNIMQLNEIIISDDTPQNKDKIQSHDQLYGFYFPPSVLIHELLHALLSNDHSRHDSVYLTLNGERTLYTFDLAANDIYQQVILNGLVDRFPFLES